MHEVQITVTNWEAVVLINLVEREYRQTKDKEFRKKDSLALLINKLQASSMGPKPFGISVNI